MEKTKTDTGTRLTPGWLIRHATQILGGSIDVDPCTEKNNPTGASVFYTKERQATPDLIPGSVWCNPPWRDMLRWATYIYGQPRENGPVLFLTGADTRPEWCRYLAKNSDHLILVHRSVKFYAVERKVSVEPSRGVYLWGRGLPESGLEYARSRPIFTVCDLA